MNFVGIVEDIGKGVDVAGITIILVGVLPSSVQFLRRLQNDVGSAYGLYRVGLGRFADIGDAIKAMKGFLLAASAARIGAERAVVASGGRCPPAPPSRNGDMIKRSQADLGRGPVLGAGHRHDLSVMPFWRGRHQLLVLLGHLVGLRVLRVGAVAGLVLEADDQPDLVGVRLAAVDRVEQEALDLPLFKPLHDVLHLLVRAGLELHPGDGSEHGGHLSE